MHAWINITHPGFSGRQDMPDDGDQWVSWEQMVATLRAKGDAEGRAALLAREVVELRGEVAKLKPLEMILLKGGDPVQHLSEAVLDLSAKVRSMEEASRLDQLEILRLTRCIAERAMKPGEIAVQQEYFDALENGDDVVKPYSVWMHDVFGLRTELRLPKDVTAKEFMSRVRFPDDFGPGSIRAESRAKDLAKLRDDFNEWAISRATGNAELEHQKADALWKTWCMIEIPDGAETKEKEPLPAVVVPEPTSDEWRALAESSLIHGDLVNFLAGAAAYGIWLRGKIRAIPADRVPGEGMVVVDRDYARCALQAIEHLISRHVSNCPTLPDIGWRKARRALRDALRASQGGAAT